MDKIRTFLQLTRANTLWLTLASCVVILTYAKYSEYFSWENFTIMILGLICLHLAINLHSDNSYIEKNLKNGTTFENIRFETHYPRAEAILNGKVSLKCSKIIEKILFILAISVGLCFMIYNWCLIFFFLMGIALAFIYPLAPKNTLREFIKSFVFAPLLIMTGYYAITMQYEPNLLLLSFAIFFVDLVFLHTQNIMDWELTDHSNSSIVTVTKHNALEILTIILAIPYIIIVLGVVAGGFDPYVLYCYLTLPIATKLIHSMREYIEIKDVQFIPRWYCGMFENWKYIKERGLSYYMFRYYLARNLAFFFALLVAIGSIS